MKTSSLVLLIFLPVSLLAGEVKTGDSVETALSVMGAPKGRLQFGDHERLCFDRGEIDARSGTVTRVALRSPEAQASLDAKYEAEGVRRREEQVRLMAAGEALKASKRSDAAFLATPLKYQVAFWENFSRQYSAISCQEELNVARARLAEQETSDAERVAEFGSHTAEETGSVYTPIYPGYYPFGYDRGYFAYENRRRRMDQEYYNRIHQHAGLIQSEDHRRDEADRHERGRHREPVSSNRSAVFCGNRSSMTVTQFADRSQISSHTAMAFTGQDWLVWPSPSKTR